MGGESSEGGRWTARVAGSNRSAPSTHRPAPDTSYYQLTHDYLVPLAARVVDAEAAGDPPGPGGAAIGRSGGALGGEAGEPAPSFAAGMDERPGTDPPEELDRRAASDDATGRSVPWPAGLRRVDRGRARDLGRSGGIRILPLHGAGRITGHRRHLGRGVYRASARGLPAWADPLLVRKLNESIASSRTRLNSRLALLPVNPSQVEPLYYRLIVADPDDLRILTDALAPHKASLVPKLWSVMADSKPGRSTFLASAGALARYDPENRRWAEVSGKLAQAHRHVQPRSPRTLDEYPQAGARAAHGSARDDLSRPFATCHRAGHRDHDPRELHRR